MVPSFPFLWRASPSKYASVTVARFSDLAERYGILNRELAQWHQHHGDRPSKVNLIENRYDTQVEVPPGEYNLRVALGDGTRFERAEIPLTVDSYDRNALSVSAISLCKQISDVSANARKLSGAWNAKMAGSYVPLLSNDVEFKPTSDTRFKTGETLYVYFEVYEPLRDGEQQVTVVFKFASLTSSGDRYQQTSEGIIPTGRPGNRLDRKKHRLAVRRVHSRIESSLHHRARQPYRRVLLLQNKGVAGLCTGPRQLLHLAAPVALH